MAVLPTGIGPVTGYNIERSLRFNSADSAYLNRTFVGTPNTYTLSMWIKRGSSFGSQMFIVGSRAGSSTDGTIQFNTSNQITVVLANTYVITTTAVYRDPAAWYHLVLSVTASGTAYLYINNVQVGSVAVGATCWLFNSTNTNTIGRYGSSASLYYDGYMTEVNFIDGQALTPSSFGETDSNTGVWKPKAYSGTYGTNGFFLKFADNSGTTSTTLGKDSSGNGNNWTPNNFSVTAGAGNDSLVDSPTNYGTDTGVGGEVRGNYATLNPLAKSSVGTLDNGNLQWTSGNSGGGTAGNGTRASIGMNVGKWYTEVTRLDTVFWSYPGISNETHLTSIYNGGDANSWSIDSSGQKVTNNSSSAYGSATWAANDIINIAYDADNGELYFGKNGTWLNSGNPVTRTNPAFTSLSGTLFFTVGFSANTASASSVVFNFGQRAFAYTAPSGFKALCTQNLPTPTIGATSTTQANDYFNAVLYTGNGASRTISGVGFQPDWVWVKARSAAIAGLMYDAVRGATKYLQTNSTAAEGTGSDSLTAFASDGFSLGADTSTTGVNQNTTTYVAWNWKANGAGSSNTAGTITSTVSANTTSGFSIVTYTGNGSSSATVGHGLGVVPAMVITKGRSSATEWMVKHQSLPSGQNLILNQTLAASASTGFSQGVIANLSSSTTFGFTAGSSGVDNANQNGVTFVAYCFAPVAGYSAFGSYTGNGSADGPFVYTGFRPRWIMIKRTDTTSNWVVWDTVRDTYNASGLGLYPNLSAAEDDYRSSNPHDVLSNGFKPRANYANVNASGGTYIYAAFAEHPFKYSLAR